MFTFFDAFESILAIIGISSSTGLYYSTSSRVRLLFGAVTVGDFAVLARYFVFPLTSTAVDSIYSIPYSELQANALWINLGFVLSLAALVASLWWLNKR